LAVSYAQNKNILLGLDRGRFLEDWNEVWKIHKKFAEEAFEPIDYLS